MCLGPVGSSSCGPTISRAQLSPTLSPGASGSSSFYSVDPEIPLPVLLLPLGLPLPLPSVNDDVEADRAGFDLQHLPSSLMDFPDSDITFPSLP